MNIFSVDIDGCITNGKGKFTDAKIVSLIHKAFSLLQGDQHPM